MTKPRATVDRCPSCGKLGGYLHKQKPTRQMYRCCYCYHEWSWWKHKRSRLKKRL